MDLRIDPTDAVPIYAQVVDQIKALIASRALRPGDPMPSVRELAVNLRINRNTASKAYQTLEAEGILASRQGQGTVVAEGGAPWSHEERVRRLERSLDRSIVEAYHLEIPFDEMPPILEERLKRFTPDDNRDKKEDPA
ncbi:MAG: GntR family transcriptional regulator [Acidobacteriota bacterium]|nr:GntR family transcriptional regulator [Acidobacteriota bacterium]MDH3786445.1 GntR family transcriptional regulator [Acidobacteriota bacterium]